jgi:DNA-binding CsgD family transcriptional regulator
VPESMFVRRDPQWAAAILQAGRDQPTTLESVVETDVVDSGRTFVVDEVQTNPRVCRPIAAMSRSENYGVAPITVERTVIGMVHVDCYLQGRPVHREKCVTLAVAAESLAAQLSRLLLLEQLQAVRATVGRSWSTTSTVVASNASGPGMSAHPELTRREVDVIRLMAAGETNYQIARRLMITVGTVKTHVSSILHKLNAANRAQAVSRWLSAQPA